MGLSVDTREGRSVGVTGRDEPRPRIFESPDSPANPEVLAYLEQEVHDADLAAPPVVLPDFHLKSTMEMPSSVAIATRNTIRPSFTSDAVNCGMALVAFEAEPPSEAAMTEFLTSMRARYPWPPGSRRELTPSEVVRCAAEGSHFAAERFGVDMEDLNRIEEGGRLDFEPYGGADRFRRELPWLVKQLSRLKFGNIGPSNHFIELQRVEEVIDPEAAELLGVRIGQLTLQYHGGGGVLTGQIGRLFGRRKAFSKYYRMEMSVQKPLYHLATARSAAEFRNRLELYFANGCPPVPRESSEGRRVMLMNVGAMNYGFAFRLAAYANMRATAKKVFGASGAKLIVDSPHDTIYEEDVGGEIAAVHRLGACRAYPAEKMTGHPVFGKLGQALLLPGTSRTSSYLCVAGSGAAQSLFSTSHGSGSVVTDLSRRGLSGPDPEGRTTIRLGYNDQGPTVLPQLDDRGVNEALGILAGNGLLRPVARLRPLAVLN